MPDEDIEITELEEFVPSRVDGVGKGANGFPVLMLKAVDDNDDCDACKGAGKIEGSMCKKCRGTGMMPTLGDTTKTLAEKAREKGVAPSGKPVPPPHDCPTCDGSGVLGTDVEPDRPCPDCNGTGRDGQYNTDNVREGFGGSMQVGDPREKIDKAGITVTVDAEAIADAMAKRDFDRNVGGGVDRDKLPASDFAGKNRSFPIVTQADVSDALASIGRAGTDNYDAATLKRRILEIARRKGFKVPKSDRKDAKKGTDVSGMNPALGDHDAGHSSSDPKPGSPEWEGVDTEMATGAASKLMEASELIRSFAQRESIEVAAGEGNDIFDTAAAEMALCDVSHALGIMAQMAFHEGLAAKKGTAVKAGRRLSTKSADALAAARDALSNLLGDDDPAKTHSDEDDSEFRTADARKAIEDMTVDELNKLLDRRDKKLVGQVTKALTKGKSRKDEDASVADAKAANRRSKSKKPKANDTALEDEAAQGTDSSASGTRDAEGGAKAARTPEEADALRQEKAAKKALRTAKKMKKQAAKSAATARAIEEATAEVRKANAVLEERLAQVEKMAAPSPVVRTRPTEALKTSAEADALDIQIDRLEQVVKSTADRDLREGNRVKLAELRARRAALPH